MSEQIPTWLPDESSPCCPECGAIFSLLRRRHHCRHCGRVVCDACSTGRAQLPQAQTPGAAGAEKGRVRVCDSCVQALTAAGEAAVASVIFDSPARPVRGMSGSSDSAPAAALGLPPAAMAQPASPAAAAVVVAPVAVPAAAAAPASSVLSPGAPAPTNVRSPVPVAVATTAPRIVPPTAAPISAPVASSSTTGAGFFGLAARLQHKVETVAARHAPGLVSAIKEQVAAATVREAEERDSKRQHSERLVAAANAADQPGAAGGAASPPQVAHIPGLGAVALAAGPVHADEQKQAREAQAWSNLPSKAASASASSAAATAAEQPAAAAADASFRTPPSKPAVGDDASVPGMSLNESELRRRKPAAVSDSPSRGAGSSSSASAAVAAAAAAAAASSTNMKMDLPLRLCLVILKKSAAEMKEKYASYLSTKLARKEGDDPLSFAQFMFFSTIRTLPDFLFRKTELAFCMMREEGDTLVFEENFVRYAPILSPLASKLDARALYLALQGASIAAGAALTPEQVAFEHLEHEESREAVDDAVESSKSKDGSDSFDGLSSAAEDSGAPGAAVTPRRPRTRAGGVGYTQFKIYVDTLKKYVKRGGEESGWPEVFSTFPELAAAGPAEQLLLVRTGVTDTTTFPPRIGRMGLTSSFLLYESSFFKRNRAIRWSAITRIERNDEGYWRKKAAAAVSAVSGASKEDTHSRGMNIYIQEDETVSAGGSSSSQAGASSSSSGSGSSGTVVKKRAEECLTWDQPGWGEAAVLERTRTFEYMRIMLALSRLVASLPDKVVASALVQETCMSMLRMRALEAVGPGTNPLLLNPFSAENISLTTRRAVDVLIPGGAIPGSLPSPAASSTLASITSTVENPSAASSSFVQSIAASISRAEAVRKSKSSWLFAVLPGLQDRAREKAEDDIDPEFASSSGGGYKTAEELAVLARAVEQPFSLKNFAYNVKLFRSQLEPLMQFFALVRRIRDWENPLLTLVTVMLLLNMAYRDLLMYLPALVVLMNIAIVATMKYYPNALQVALGAGAGTAASTVNKDEDAAGGGGGLTGAGTAHGAMGVASTATVEELLDEPLVPAGGAGAVGTSGESKEEREAALLAASGASGSKTPAMGATSSQTSLKPYHLPTAQPVASPAASSSSASKAEADAAAASGGGGLLTKLRTFRDVAVRTKEYLHSVQNQIGEHNVRFMKVEGLYKWRTPSASQRFFLMLCIAFVVLVAVPFRFIFPVLVLDFFTTKWQHTSSFERLMDEVALPQQMPDVD